MKDPVSSSPLDPDATKRQLRRLHGEPSVDGSPAHSDGLRAPDRIESLWRALVPPTVSEPPPDFAARTAEALRQRQAAGVWSVAPVWARAGAAAALAAGLLLGMGFGNRVTLPGDAASGIWLDSELWTEAVGSEDLTDDTWTEAWSKAYESSFGDEIPTGDS